MRHPRFKRLSTLCIFFDVSTSSRMSRWTVRLILSTHNLPFSSFDVIVSAVALNPSESTPAHLSRNNNVEHMHSAREAASSLRASEPNFSLGTWDLLRIKSLIRSLWNLILRSCFKNSSSILVSDLNDNPNTTRAKKWFDLMNEIASDAQHFQTTYSDVARVLRS